MITSIPVIIYWGSPNYVVAKGFHCEIFVSVFELSYQKNILRTDMNLVNPQLNIN